MIKVHELAKKKCLTASEEAVVRTDQLDEDDRLFFIFCSIVHDKDDQSQPSTIQTRYSTALSHQWTDLQHNSQESFGERSSPSHRSCRYHLYTIARRLCLSAYKRIWWRSSNAVYSGYWVLFLIGSFSRAIGCWWWIIHVNSSRDCSWRWEGIRTTTASWRSNLSMRTALRDFVLTRCS